MGLPALRQFPRIAADSTVRLSETGETARSLDREETFDLPTIVESVFDPSEDLVFYELSSGAKDVTARGAGVLMPGGAALAAAVASAEAIERMGRRQFVVVMADPDLLDDELQAELTSLLRVRRRFVVVAPADPRPDAIGGDLAAGGWRVTDLRGRTDARQVAKSLVVARYEEQPALIVVDREATARLPGKGHPFKTPDEPPPAPAPASHLDAMLTAELRRQIAADHRLAPVVVVDDPLWRALERSDTWLGDATTDRSVKRALTIGMALSCVGCRPVVVADQGELAACRSLLKQITGARKFTGVIIALDRGRASEHEIEWPVEFDQRVLPPDCQPKDLAAMLGECIRSERPVVLHVPVERVVTKEAYTASESNGLAARSRIATDADAVGAGRSAATLESAGRQIREYRFNAWQQKWVDEYSGVGKRDVYLWRWTGRAVEWLTLSCVASEWRSSVCDTKFLAAMFNVLLDDIVDERRDQSAMVDLQSLMGDDPGPAIRRLGSYGDFIGRVWEEIQRRVREYPREPEFRRLLSYDFRQLCNQVDYSGLLHRHPHLINQTEHDLYSPHGMMVACTATLDLTCSPGFRNEDLGVLREAVWHANSMARIGNLVTTWQREIGHDDFSSGVFARAVSLGCLDADDLSSSNRPAIEAAINKAGIEQEFADRWRTHRQRLIELAPRASSVSLLGLLEGLDRLMASEYASRGFK